MTTHRPTPAALNSLPRLPLRVLVVLALALAPHLAVASDAVVARPDRHTSPLPQPAPQTFAMADNVQLLGGPGTTQGCAP